MLESVLAILKRKELLQGLGVSSSMPLGGDAAADAMQATYKIEPSDIREALKELGIVKQYSLPSRTSTSSLSMISGGHNRTSFNRQLIED